MGLDLVMFVEPVGEFCANRFPEWHLTKHLCLRGHPCLTPQTSEKLRICAHFSMANMLIVGETLQVRLVLAGAVEKVGCQ